MLLLSLAAGFVIVKFGGVKERAYIDAQMNDLQNMALAQEQYFLDHSTYTHPDTLLTQDRFSYSENVHLDSLDISSSNEWWYARTRHEKTDVKCELLFRSQEEVSKIAQRIVCPGAGVGGAGSLLVRTHTTGTNPDDSYQVTIVDGTTRTIGANDTENFASRSPGTHTVELTDVASHCEVTGGSSSREVIVLQGQQTETTFDVDCDDGDGSSTGALVVRTRTDGTNVDNSYQVNIATTGSQTAFSTSAGLGANDSQTFSGLEVGPYSVDLSDVASNCQTVWGGLSRSAEVEGGNTIYVTYNIHCEDDGGGGDNTAPTADFTADSTNTNTSTSTTSTSDNTTTVLADLSADQTGSLASVGTFRVDQSLEFISTSTDPDGDDLSESWTFGEEADQGTVVEKITGSGTIVTNKYLETGTDTITLIVSDGQASDTVQKTITIEDGGGTDSDGNTAPVADFTADSTDTSTSSSTTSASTTSADVSTDQNSGLSSVGTFKRGQPLKFTSTSTDADGDTLTENWDFGEPEQLGVDVDRVAGKGPEIFNEYFITGTDTVTLIVSDGQAADTAKKTITLEDPTLADEIEVTIDGFEVGERMPIGATTPFTASAQTVNNTGTNIRLEVRAVQMETGQSFTLCGPTTATDSVSCSGNLKTENSGGFTDAFSYILVADAHNADDASGASPVHNRATRPYYVKHESLDYACTITESSTFNPEIEARSGGALGDIWVIGSENREPGGTTDTWTLRVFGEHEELGHSTSDSTNYRIELTGISDTLSDNGYVLYNNYLDWTSDASGGGGVGSRLARSLGVSEPGPGTLFHPPIAEYSFTGDLSGTSASATVELGESQQPVTVTWNCSGQPVADFDHLPEPSAAGLTVEFDDQSTPGTGTIADYDWDIGNDGTTDYTTANPNHVFPDVGEYPVRLEIADDGGNTASEIDTVTVGPPGKLRIQVDPELAYTVHDSGQSVPMTITADAVPADWVESTSALQDTLDKADISLKVRTYHVPWIQYGSHQTLGDTAQGTASVSADLYTGIGARDQVGSNVTGAFWMLVEASAPGYPNNRKHVPYYVTTPNSCTAVHTNTPTETPDGVELYVVGTEYSNTPQDLIDQGVAPHMPEAAVNSPSGTDIKRLVLVWAENTELGTHRGNEQLPYTFQMVKHDTLWTANPGDAVTDLVLDEVTNRAGEDAFTCVDECPSDPLAPWRRLSGANKELPSYTQFLVESARTGFTAIFDDGSGTVDATADIVCQDLYAPRASLANTNFGTATGWTTPLDGSASYDRDGTIETYRWSFKGQDSNNDHVSEVITSSDPQISWTPPTEGSYNITLSVRDDDGFWNKVSDVGDLVEDYSQLSSPVANFSYWVENEFSPETIVVGDTVAFHDESTPSDDSSIDQLEWDIDGDGTNEFSGAAASFGVEEVEHAYQSAGTYDVRLIAIEADGTRDTVTKSITIDP